MEKEELAKQYSYKATANLVLTSENRRRDAGPTGEVESIVDNIGIQTLRRRFGDRATRTKPKELEERLARMQAKKRARLAASDMDGTDGIASDASRLRKSRRVEHESVLDADIEQLYRPQTRDTRAAYEVLLNFLQQELPSAEHDVLRSAANEVLIVLKEDGKRDNDKKQEISELLMRRSPMSDDRFTELFNIGRRITDFQSAVDSDSKDGSMALNSDIGVNVIIDDEDDGSADDDDFDIVADASDDEFDDAQQAANGNTGAAAGAAGAAASTPLPAVSIAGGNTSDTHQESEDDELDARSIDAYWLQRKVAEHYKDAREAQSMADDVFGVLSAPLNASQVENKLVRMLRVDKLSLIKLLMRNRLKIVYCMRLARASSDDDRKVIHQEMATDPKLMPILKSLRRSATASDHNMGLERQLQREARELKQSTSSSDGSASSTSEANRSTQLQEDAFWAKRPKQMLDLPSLSFDKGAHLMSNIEVKLPQSEVITKPGYQEVHIPPLKPQPYMDDEKHVPITDIPQWAQPAFAGMEKLNRIQSRVYKTAMFSAENVLMCAPTGAGKTNVAMLTILREIGMYRREDGTIDLDAFKIVYVAPMKSLVREMVMNFGKRLQSYGITVRELSGDEQLTKAQIDETQVIVTTPEKWDIITRKSGGRAFTELVRLIIIDEVHLLHDSRGPVLESIVARTIRQIETTQEMVRLVGLSATLPNYEDVAMFLRVKKDTGLFFFDNSFRPCPLQQQYIGLTKKNAFQRKQLENEVTYEKTVQHVERADQVIVFVHSRKDTGITARSLYDTATERDQLQLFLKDDSARAEMLKEESANCKNETLRELLAQGFAIHHAGLPKEDRAIVEDLFADGHIKVLVSTATLAWGVNLPAHTVIIKGTQVYSPEKGTWVELSPQDVMQMLGRAGRPQYDKFGEGIVITTHKELHYYLSLLNEQLPIESQFMSKLADNLNAEIVSGAVTNMQEAVTWLGYTYMYVRMLGNPRLYGVPASMVDEDATLEQRRVDLVHTAASLLHRNNLIRYDRKSGNFFVTELGRVASHFYITYQSIASFNDYLKPTISDIELLRIFSLSEEFKYMRVREEEKYELAQLLDKVPIPVKEGIDEPTSKVNVLLQAFISNLKLEGYALMSDMVYVTQSAGRVMRALFEIVLKRGWAGAAERCLTMCQMVSRRMWAAQSPLRQFGFLPKEVVKRIEGKDMDWEHLFDLEPYALGDLVRFQKMGKHLHRGIHSLPRLALEGHVQPITRSVLRVELTITPDFRFDPKIHGNVEPFFIWVEDVDGETILHSEYFLLKRQYATEEHVTTFTIPIHDPMPPQYFVRVVSDRWLGARSTIPISFRKLLLPERYAPPTELLDLRPRAITDVGNERYLKFFEGRFDYFNPIQTQAFNSLYKSDKNVLLAAPTGSGKTVCAELAILRMLSQRSNGKCVYVAPFDSLVEERMADWAVRFAKTLGIKVVKLTGDTASDLKLLQTGQLVLSSPEHWDIMSRRWTTRKVVQNISLFIVDELHLIGGRVGPTLEVIVSRMRYISEQTQRATRIVALSASVANARDLAEWIGASSSNQYSFHPHVRPLPLEISIQGFDMNNFQARLLAMTRPAYMNIQRSSPTKPVIVFVPSRKIAQRVAVDLMTFVETEDTGRKFLHIDAKEVEPFVSRVSNRVLKETLQAGVGFLHEGLSAVERRQVETLYEAGATQVVVVEQSLCWGLSLAAHLVVIMGTEAYDGREHRYIDFPIANIVQMMGRACRPGRDESGKCSIMCHSSKKAFFKKFLYEPFPVESHLDHHLADHLNAEIVTKRVKSAEDAVDFLTWSFYYIRMTQNPNYYGLKGVSNRHLSDHLSELVETTLEDLEQSGCVTVEDDSDVSPLNLGMIAAFYYIKYHTVEIFNQSLSDKTRLRGLLEILASAEEFDSIPVRHREDRALQRLAHHLPLKIENAGMYNDPHTKTNVLLQSHFSRLNLQAAVAQDKNKVLPDAVRLLHSMVDVISSKGWLKPALACMEMSQMIVQGMWSTSSPLMQMPHFTPELVTSLEKQDITNVFDFIDMDDDDRMKLLPPAKLFAVAKFCEVYPNVDVKFQVQDADDISAGDAVSVVVELVRDADDDSDSDSSDSDDDDNQAAAVAKKSGKKPANPILPVPEVYAPRFPQKRTEGWWLVIGDVKLNSMAAIKRIVLKRKTTRLQLQFTAPSQGSYQYTLFLMNDALMGCDQEYEFALNVAEGSSDSDSDSDSGSDSDSDSGDEQQSSSAAVAPGPGPAATADTEMRSA
jgi:pre-mRNA-splicing helicase BRR2